MKIWDSVYKSYPLNIEELQPAQNGRISRVVAEGKLIEPCTLNNFMGNATGLWNRAPCVIRNAKSISTVKKEIKKYCLTLPF